MLMFEGKTIQETCSDLKTNSAKGLSEKEAVRRLSVYGRNALPESRKKSLIASFLEQLHDPLIYILLAASAISLLLDEISDTAIILAVVFINAVVGLIQEGKAQKALDSLKKLTSPHAIVIRDAKQKEIPASDLVPGDLVCLDAGCQVPADLRLTLSENLKAEESTLTGESVPVEKKAGFIASSSHDIPLGDRLNMAYMSTIITYGRGQGIVTATGMDTQIGRIASLIQTNHDDTTPLQKKLGDLGKILSFLSILLCVLLFAIAVWQKRNIFEMLLTAISLAVAAVPEGLPAVVTICLALSVTRMVRVNTIIRRLPAVETLGSVNIVCSDKTGTLTQNRMTVSQCYVNQEVLGADSLHPSTHKEFLYAMTLCNDAVLNKSQSIGDPTELALLALSSKYGCDRPVLEKTLPRREELPFDSDRKMMSTFHRCGTQTVTYTKGAPDEVLSRCTTILLQGRTVPLTASLRRQIRRAQSEMSSQALRTLAFAMKTGKRSPSEQDLTFLGMVGMLDPARPEAADAVRRFRDAGVSTVMITGDHVDTAYAIASQLSIVSDRKACLSGSEMRSLSHDDFLKRLDYVRVFARISPEQKVQIVTGFREKGNVVAMTGDGVNDAPSLKAADIGISMGMNGTDVAKQASDMILTDDNFATIEKAIEEGRGVYENIKKTVIFLLSSNLGEILTMFIAVVLGLASPLKSSHILWINLITDSLPALALGIDRNDGKALMKCPPRPASENLFAHGALVCTIFYGILIAAISLAAFFTLPYLLLTREHLALTFSNLIAALQTGNVLQRSQTYAFTVLGMCQLFHAIGMRSVRTSFFRMKHLDNKLMIVACITGILLQFLVTEIPFFINAFGTVHLTFGEWSFLTVLSAFPLFAHEMLILCTPRS